MNADFEPRRRRVFAGVVIAALAATVGLADAADGPSAETQKTAAASANAAPSAPAEVTTLSLTVTLEDGAQKPLELKLRDRFSRTVKAWKNVAPGDLRLEAPKLEPGSYTLHLRADGYAQFFTRVTVAGGGATISRNRELPRKRYALLRYDVNVKGKRQLTGPDVKQYRLAVTHFANLPELRGDFLVRQDLGSENPTELKLSMHSIGENHGFADVPPGTAYDDITEAPTNDQYKPNNFVCTKGAMVLTRVKGHKRDMQRYAKILVEDVTDTPPKDVEVIDQGDLFWRDRER